MFGGPSFFGGFLVGFGTGFVSREITRIGLAVAKPLTKSFVKAAVSSLEKGKESIAYFGESFEDLVAEVKVGMKAKPAAATAASGKASPAKEPEAESTPVKEAPKKKQKGSAT